MQIKGIHNTVANAISQLNINTLDQDKINWIHSLNTGDFTHIQQAHRTSVITNNKLMWHLLIMMNKFSLSVDRTEIAQAQMKDASLKKLAQQDKYSTQFVDNTQLLSNDGKLFIPNDLEN